MDLPSHDVQTVQGLAQLSTHHITAYQQIPGTHIRLDSTLSHPADQTFSSWHVQSLYYMLQGMIVRGDIRLDLARRHPMDNRLGLVLQSQGHVPTNHPIQEIK